MLGGIVGTFDEDQPLLAMLGRVIEFALGRGYALRILQTVFVAEEAEVNIASRHFGEIHFVRSPIGRRQILKQKDIEEAPQQRIAVDVILQRRRSAASSFCTLLMKMRCMRPA